MKLKKYIICILFLIIISIFYFKILYPVFIADEVILELGFKTIDISSKKEGMLWKNIKVSYIMTFYFSYIIIYNYIYKRIGQLIEFNKRRNMIKNFDNNLKLKIGTQQENDKEIYIPESGLYQNFLITGTIGTGKTSSAMYPFTRTITKIQL